MTNPAVQLCDVSKSFGGNKVLSDINLSIEPGEFVVFVGASGCGKSTLLRLIAGLEDISSGEVLIDGDVVNDTHPSQRGVAMVFQSYALYPHMTVEQNIGFSMRLAGEKKPAIAEKVGVAARILKLGDLLLRKPSQISGGQRQRVAIGRAIVRNPKVFLFDEPLSNLDAALRVHMRLELERLHNDLRATMIYVTHDQVEAMTLADKIVVLDEGEIQQQGSPIQLYTEPGNSFVATFIGSPAMNLAPARINADGEVEALGQTFSGLPLTGGGGNAILGVRPEHLSLGGEGDFSFQVVLSQVEHLGAETLMYCRADGEALLTVRTPGVRRVTPGEALTLSVGRDSLYVFEDGSGPGEGRALIDYKRRRPALQ